MDERLRRWIPQLRFFPRYNVPCWWFLVDNTVPAPQRVIGTAPAVTRLPDGLLTRFRAAGPVAYAQQLPTAPCRIQF